MLGCCCVNVLSVPLPMFFSHYVFSRKFYTFWTACSMYVPFVSRPRYMVGPLILMAQYLGLCERNVLHYITIVGVSQGDGDDFEGGIS